MSLWYPQAEVCSGAVADVLQCVVGGSDGCIFSFGPRSLGKCWALVSGWASLGGRGAGRCPVGQGGRAGHGGDTSGLQARHIL